MPGEVQEIREKIRALRQEIEQARQAADNGGFDGSSKGPIQQLKMRRQLKGRTFALLCVAWRRVAVGDAVVCVQAGQLTETK